jgi:pyruvate/2-oxoglutarate dehydrogenase complex dihydrolipoamide dehydrogenase (E3) component
MKPDVIIIGSGQAGVPLATRLAQTGKHVLIAERAALGGTCVNTGCTPTKTLVASARAAHVARTASRLGIHVGRVDVDFAAVMARRDGIVERWRGGVERRLASAPERIEVRKARARFVGERTVEIDGQRISAETVIVNVGARPARPRIAGLETVSALDYESLQSLRELPKHLLILGGGYIGCEFGQMFRRFGSEVTIVEHSAHLLAREDQEISAALEGVFRGEGIGLEFSADVEAVRQEEEVVLRLKGGKELRGSHLLLATGRVPNTDDVGCDSAGVRLDARGFIEVGEDFATTAEGVFAVGDVTGEPQFTHTAWDDHRLLFERLQQGSCRPRSQRIIPFTVFTDPQVAGVGLTEREARARNLRFEVANMAFGDIARAIEIDETAGVMKILIDPESEQVLGCRLMGAEAGELIHVFLMLMQAKTSVRPLVEAEFVHPSFAEGVQSLVMRLPRFALG